MIRPVIMERVLAALICCEFAIGQVTDKRWEFEVASVKPAPPYHGEDTFPRGGPGTSDLGQVTYERTWLLLVVAKTYEPISRSHRNENCRAALDIHRG